MRLLRRRAEAVPADEREVAAHREVAEEPETLERRDLVEHRWSPGNVVTALAGAALATLGIVALVRTGVDSTWYTPVVQVGGIDHTPLLAAIEVGVGALLVILGLSGSRALTAFVCLAVAVAAAVAAIDPAQVQPELAIERSWAITLAASAATLAVISMLPWPSTVERRAAAGVRGRGYTVHQH
jgi:hypothetical protein